jgi:UDP-N-acetylglucosamine diphosphorylase/glucosamine-1-phosphate N-acetyltransferase
MTEDSPIRELPKLLSINLVNKDRCKTQMMSKYVLFDDELGVNFLPFTYTVAVAELRVGIFTFLERLEKLSSDKVYVSCKNSVIQKKYPAFPNSDSYLFINSRVVLDERLFQTICQLEIGQGLKSASGSVIAYKVEGISSQPQHYLNIEEDVLEIRQLWDIFMLNNKVLELDFNLLTKGREGAALSITNHLIGSPSKLFIEEGAIVEGAILNTQSGSIYIGKNSEVMEGVTIRGGFVLCEGAVVKMGAKIYGATTIGPFSKVGGEVNNSVIFGYSNKGHDGFLGNSVLGYWCNLGADTNNSNLKNNYGNVRVWSCFHEKYIDSGLQFCGVFMGDHSKTGINTMLNTGTVVGVFANVFWGRIS